jgi:hypothetical protein
MRQTAKKASVWAFSALFGCISLLGSGWHCFLGHAFHPAACHHATDRHAGHAEHADHEHPGHDHAVACAGHEHAAGEDSPSVASVHDCPLCKFFAQAQWAAAIQSVEIERAVCGAPASAEQAVRLACLGLYHSRAPPALG